MTAKAWPTLVTGRADPSGAYKVDDLLHKASADYLVVTNPIFVYDQFQDAYMQIPNRYATGREVQDGGSTHLDSWEVVTDRYEVEQNGKILSRAIAVVNKYGGAARLLGCGVLDEGRKFFAVVNTGSLSITTSQDGTDIIDSYVVVMSSHDGSIPICYYNLDSRRSTHSVYRFAAPTHCEFSVRKRHTPSAADLDSEAKEVLSMRTDWSKYTVDTISGMCIPISSRDVDDTLEKVWPLAKASTEKKREHLESVHDQIKTLFTSPLNSGAYGATKWALLNAMTEYIDFHRNIPDSEAAQHALEVDNYSHRLKLSVFGAINTI